MPDKAAEEAEGVDTVVTALRRQTREVDLGVTAAHRARRHRCKETTDRLTGLRVRPRLERTARLVDHRVHRTHQ